LLDIEMTKIDGFELYEQLTKMDDEVKVRFITDIKYILKH